MTAERIYVLGGTGNVGTVTVKELLKSKIPVTLYARSSAKAKGLFGDDPNLTIIEGDLANRKPFEDSITGHTRLFLLVDVIFEMQNKCEVDIARTAYAAGVKQIVDISSLASTLPWRSSFIGELSRSSEEGIASIPNRGAYVALRPAHFMSNLLWLEMSSIKTSNAIMDKVDPEAVKHWISPNDIGLAAANILRDPIEKHGDAVYEMLGDIVTMKDCTDLVSKALGRKISYIKITPVDMYRGMMEKGFPHLLAYEFSKYLAMPDQVTPGLSILLGREPETLAQWLHANKNALIEAAAE